MRPAADVLADVAAEAKWNSVLAKSMAGQVERLRTYLGLREAGKHSPDARLRGHPPALLELDRRFGLNGGIFFLTPDELPDLVAGTDLQADDRRAATDAAADELTLEVPPVLFSDDLDAIGRPLPDPRRRPRT